MITLASTQVWVRDQDEAVAFWTEKVGFEVKEDVTVPDLGNFRWVTVGPTGQFHPELTAAGLQGWLENGGR